MRAFAITFSILLILITRTTCDDFNYQLMKDYLLYINVRIVLLTTHKHESQIEIIEKSRNFQNDGFWINHWNIQNESEIVNFNYQRFFLRSSHQICVVIKLGTKQTQRILHEISDRKMFHFERFWLMFGVSSERTFAALSEENINVDANIATVVPVGGK